MDEVNKEGVLRSLEVEAARYEEALMANDAERLVQFFWDSPHAVRYGPNEHLYGSEEISRFRASRSPKNLQRTVTRREVTTIGESTGFVNVQFERVIDGEIQHGRMSQFWRRFPELGWRIVSAHVSSVG